MFEGRWYQERQIVEVQAAWSAGHTNALFVLPTGGGKTYVFARLAESEKGASVAIAHRGELVSQLSVAFARQGLYHAVIGPSHLQSACRQAQVEALGHHYIEPSSRVRVASVDTLRTQGPKLGAWLSQVRLWMLDEAHHLLRSNKWGAAVNLFPNSRGVGGTATAERADGKGLGRHADGLFDSIALGPPMRQLIDEGYLCEYRVFAPQSHLDLSSVPLSANGDYSPPKLAEARMKSSVTGDVVSHYKRLAFGKLGVVFDVSIESATQTAKSLQDEGVAAAVVHGAMDPGWRAELLRQFRAGSLRVIVNVDLFGEGFDLPAIEFVSMARPTQSYAVFAQQFGRALRTMPGKSHALVIDHVGNCLRHGLPDSRWKWSLDARERRSKGRPAEAIPVRVCATCAGAYERILQSCPYCGQAPAIGQRTEPAFVDGDLTELDPSVLAKLRGEAERILDPPLYPRGLSEAAAGALRKRHAARQEAQGKLRSAIALWAGWQRSLGRGDPEIYRRFYFLFGTDIATSQTLNTQSANELTERINDQLSQNRVTSNAI